MEQEIWIDIPNYEGLYQVSNLGNIKSLERFFIIPRSGGKKKVEEKILSFQYDLKKNLINEFFSSSEAYEKTEINEKNIQAVCSKRRKTAGGFLWSYTKLKF